MYHVFSENGILPKYLIQNHHEGIVGRDEFDAVQLEMTRRRALTGGTKKSAPTGRGKYSGKYALSNLLFCDECGTAYRRCVWTQNGQKRIVWRCGSRLDYGKKYCQKSPTLDEKPLQIAILNALNSVMDDCGILTQQLANAMKQELAPIPGETMSLGEIDRTLEDLGRQFDSLLKEASPSGSGTDYTEQFRMISTEMAEFKERKKRIEGIHRENEQLYQRVRTVSEALEEVPVEITVWDERLIYQRLEKVTVLSQSRIRITFQDGTEVESDIEKAEKMRIAV